MRTKCSRTPGAHALSMGSRVAQARSTDSFSSWAVPTTSTLHPAWYKRSISSTWKATTAFRVAAASLTPSPVRKWIATGEVIVHGEHRRNAPHGDRQPSEGSRLSKSRHSSSLRASNPASPELPCGVFIAANLVVPLFSCPIRVSLQRARDLPSLEARCRPQLTTRTCLRINEACPTTLQMPTQDAVPAEEVHLLSGAHRDQLLTATLRTLLQTSHCFTHRQHPFLKSGPANICGNPQPLASAKDGCERPAR